MTHDASRRASLRQLAAPHSLDFGTRLLDRGSGGVFTFREFVAVAREIVAERPEQTAVYLAALVALDMAGDEHERPRAASVPSAN